MPEQPPAEEWEMPEQPPAVSEDWDSELLVPAQGRFGLCRPGAMPLCPFSRAHPWPTVPEEKEAEEKEEGHQPTASSASASASAASSANRLGGLGGDLSACPPLAA